MPENISHAALNAAVEELLEGSFDLHVHSAPDLTGELRWTRSTRADMPRKRGWRASC